MTKVYFVRHAQSNYENHNDRTRELTSKGLQDRRLVTEYLKDKQIDVVLSSPYMRSVDTVKDFADMYGFEITTIEDFRERKVDSCWIEDFYGFSKNQWEDFDYKLQDGESLREVQSRNIVALKQVVQEHAGKNVVVGSHGTALSTIINFYQPTFDFAEFERVKGIMPWIVCFTFEEEKCIEIEEINVFEKA